MTVGLSGWLHPASAPVVKSLVIVANLAFHAANYPILPPARGPPNQHRRSSSSPCAGARGTVSTRSYRRAHPLPDTTGEPCSRVNVRTRSYTSALIADTTPPTLHPPSTSVA